ncbi:variable large family protein, partial [Borreliella afzelii]
GDNGAVADAGSVKGIANGIKGIVDAAGKAFGKDGALKDVAKVADDDKKEAGKLFATQAGGAVADAAAIGKAAGAVTAVSGEQILKAIVDAAAAGGADQDGKKAEEAKNPIAAAIGTDAGAAAAFNDEMKKRNDKIAAAIVLRGVAKDGKFAVADADSKASVKSAVDEVSKWLEEMIKAAAEAAKGGTGGNNEKIEDSDNNKGAVADKDSVKGIANGIKGIVDAAGKAFGKDGNALKDVAKVADDAAGANANAGKLFAGNGAGKDGNADDANIAKAAGAVSAVSGEQILKAIVDAAGAGAANQDGKKAEEAKNPIEAAIGTAGDGAAFNDDMKKSNDNIAAAIVLRGVAKGGKFAVAADDGKKASVKSAVESAVDEVSAWLEEMIKAAAEAATKGGDAGGGADKIGDAANNQGAKADASSVKGIANGIKGIVDAAGKAFGKDGKDGDALKDVAAAAADADKKEAGKLFAAQAGGAAAAADIAKAAGAVSAVSGEQILKAIVNAAGAAAQVGKKADAAKNPIEAAIGADAAGAGAEFNEDGMKKSDNIAAAIVLRGVAKGGKFAAAANDAANVKSAVESAVDEVSAWLEEMITAAGEAAKVGDGGDDKIGDVGANKGAVADEGSVRGIAKGIKGIVDAAGKAFGKDGNALKDVAKVADDDKKEANKDAGKLFAGANGDAAAADDIKKAA